jgi:hypothetical protein
MPWVFNWRTLRAVMGLTAVAKSLHSLSVFRQGFPILGVQIGS